MTAGILSSIPRENLVFVPRRINGHLRPGERVIAMGAATQLTLPSPRGSGPIEVLNNTGTEVAIVATNGATISGTNVISGGAFSDIGVATLPQNGRAILISTGANWDALGCTGTLNFTYNGTPLASNGGNPLAAGDLLHWFWIQNGNANPSGSSYLTSAQSSDGGGGGWGTSAVLSDRAAPSANSAQSIITNGGAGEWVGWQISSSLMFRPSGVLFLTHGVNNTQHPQNFEIKLNTGAGLNSSSAVSGWTTIASFSNRTEITTASTWHFFDWTPPSSPGNQFAIRASGVNSSGLNALLLQEVCWFGEVE